jgi:photosystem II stability/assembly factor-like uncharacterized protein
MSQTSERWALLAGGIALAVAAVFLAHGWNRQHALYDAGAAEFGIVQMATNISERVMVSDATFGGVSRHSDGRLYSTYDRQAAGKSKQSCPT